MSRSALRSQSASLSQHIQKLARTHDANPGVFLDRQEMRITGHDEGRTTLNGRGDVLVIVGIAARHRARAPSTQVGEDNNRLEPDHHVDGRPMVLPHLRVRERPQRFFSAVNCREGGPADAYPSHPFAGS
jgi:hypothetical protein